MPKYKHASYGNETIRLENGRIRVDVHKRLTGWGWAEIHAGDGTYVGVLDHLGEVMLRDQEMPMRLEAAHAVRSSGTFGERLTFAVASLVVQQKLKGTSFEQWIHYPFAEPAMEGEVTLTVPPDEAALLLSFRLRSRSNLFARYVRGPWVKFGEGDFGTAKTDAIFPGVEWLQGEEWSSGTDWFKDPWAQRFAPHPNKVAVPLMAISRGGVFAALAWDPRQDATRWFNDRVHRPQPVFAAPNFIDRMNNQLMGLMVPDAQGEGAENRVYADPPLELHKDQEVRFDAELRIGAGDSLDAVVDWVKRHGLPPPPPPRWPLEQALERIATAYNTRFWHEGKGFGFAQHPGAEGPHEPGFAEGYLRLFPNGAAAAGLREKLAWCRSQPGYAKPHSRFGAVSRIRDMTPERLAAYGEELLSYQRVDGAFPFDPDGRHYMKDDFVVAREYLEPMGHAGDTALDICVVPAAELIALWEATGEPKYRDAAILTLEFCMPMKRPEGGDFWETPLRSPNLLAAGHAALAYTYAFQTFGETRYREKAVYWLRALLPFTHLWQPERLPMMYNTKPCLCSSDWYFANWVRDHVQWEALVTFAAASEMGMDWGALDPEIDWHRYQEGITVAALRWMVDHRDNAWHPHNLPWTLELYRSGALDDCYADTHNSVTGLYGGMVIPPDPIAINLIAILERNMPSKERGST